MAINSETNYSAKPTCPLVESLNPGWMPFWKIPDRQMQDIKLKTAVI